MNDKLLHAICGAVIGAFFTLAFGTTVGFCVVILAGVGKEVFDCFRHGKPDPIDAVATIAAGWIAVAVVGVLV